MRIVGRILLGISALAGALWIFGPYEDATLTPNVDVSQIGSDLDAYFAAREADYDDIKAGVEKRVIWNADPGVQTEWSVLYVHGFSATSEEIRPVPDDVARALGANLVYTRLRGHGRTNDAMAEGSVQGWMTDVAEGLAAARIAGRRVLVISTSTGGTLVAAAAHDADMMQNVAGLVFVSPNFGINNPVASLITWPAARWWLPLLAGDRRRFEPRNELHGTFWTTEYPSVAVMPMGALIKTVNKLDHSKARVPALFWYSERDQVVRADATAIIASQWGGPVKSVDPALGENDDPYAHVIAGNVMSPSQTEPTTRGILSWVETVK